jgi:hypothetical protein
MELMSLLKINPIRRFGLPQTAFLICVLCLLPLNIAALYKEIRGLGRIRQKIPFIFMGNKFLGLNSVLKGENRIGYYTDKDLDVNQHALQFAQAQYILAPIILELNNTSLHFVLFDCTTEEAAMQKIKDAGLVPIKKNQFGLILARNISTQEKSRPRLRVPFWNHL